MPISPAQIVATYMEKAKAEIRVAMPAEVRAFNASTKRVDVRPVIKDPLRNSAGDLEVEELPTIPNVRVAFQRGGGFFVRFPLSVGDTGLLVIADFDPAQWFRTGEIREPGDERAHALGNAVFLPVSMESNADVSGDGVDGSAMVLGKEGGSALVAYKDSTVEVGGNSDAAALASKVDDLASKFNAHTHAAGTLVDSSSGACTGATATPTGVYSGGASGSSKLKVGG